MMSHCAVLLECYVRRICCFLVKIIELGVLFYESVSMKSETFPPEKIPLLILELSLNPSSKQDSSILWIRLSNPLNASCAWVGNCSEHCVPRSLFCSIVNPGIEFVIGWAISLLVCSPYEVYNTVSHWFPSHISMHVVGTEPWMGSLMRSDSGLHAWFTVCQ